MAEKATVKLRDGDAQAGRRHQAASRPSKLSVVVELLREYGAEVMAEQAKQEGSAR